jgi:hypothetical protein
MYDPLTTTQLTVLQKMLFEAVEEAYRLINVQDGDPTWMERYHPMHQELGHLFIEAGEELLVRLNRSSKRLARQCP